MPRPPLAEAPVSSGERLPSALGALAVPSLTTSVDPVLAPTSVAPLTLILVAQPGLKEIRDLDAMTIGIDRNPPIGADVIKTALEKSGAPSARLMRSSRSDVDRLVEGDVQAIVLGLVSRKSVIEAAVLPTVAGYSVIALPLVGAVAPDTGPRP